MKMRTSKMLKLRNWFIINICCFGIWYQQQVSMMLGTKTGIFSWRSKKKELVTSIVCEKLWFFSLWCWETRIWGFCQSKFSSANADTCKYRGSTPLRPHWLKRKAENHANERTCINKIQKRCRLLWGEVFTSTVAWLINIRHSFCKSQMLGSSGWICLPLEQSLHDCVVLHYCTRRVTCTSVTILPIPNDVYRFMGQFFQ